MIRYSYLLKSGERSWVIVSEANDFVWPGPDLRFIPGKGVESSPYGFLPPSVFTTIRDRFVARFQKSGRRLVSRSE